MINLLTRKGFGVLEQYLVKPPKHKKDIFKIVKYILPNNAYKTIQHQRDGSANVSSYQNLYGDQMTGNLILRVLQRGTHCLSTLYEVTLKDV